MSFVYPPLTGNQPIRLVRLEPALTLSQPIRCHLEQVYLDDCRGKKPTYTYEALSYTWGARIGTVAINCNDSSLLVTPNCESALRHLRHRTKDRVLWIDAICINQQSVEEKNNQVPLMGEIYRSAAAVIIWLGPGLQGEEGTLRWAHLAGWAIYIRTPPGEPLPTNKLIRMASGAICESSFLPKHSPTLYLIPPVDSIEPSEKGASYLRQPVVRENLDDARGSSCKESLFSDRPCCLPDVVSVFIPQLD